MAGVNIPDSVTMTRFVATLGFNSHRVTRSVIAYGASGDDRIELIHPEQPDSTASERTEQAITDVEATLNGAVGPVTITSQPIESDGFQQAIATCSQLLVADPSPVVCLGGGATDVQVPLQIASVIHADQVEDVMLFSDLNGAAEQAPIPEIPIDIPGRARPTFVTLIECLDDQSLVTISDLAAAAEISESSASRHVADLNERGFVTTDRIERGKVLSLTAAGQLIANQLMPDNEQ